MKTTENLFDNKFLYTTEQNLSDFSTFGIGGPAKFFAKAHNKKEMQQIVTEAFKSGVPIYILGRGSNSLFDDCGFDGLVVMNCIDFCDNNENVFHVGGGFSFAKLGRMTANMGYSGLEFAAGIPASVGGAIFMNAGASGSSVSDVLDSVECLTANGDLLSLKRNQMSFDYRKSMFQQSQMIILEANFVLEISNNSREKQKELLSYRLRTQPYGKKSAGCVFKNPPGKSAGYLIESVGLKGVGIGGALISDIHANFIINSGGAKAKDVLELIKLIQERVFREHNIFLEPEVNYVPYRKL